MKAFDYFQLAGFVLVIAVLYESRSDTLLGPVGLAFALSFALYARALFLQARSSAKAWNVRWLKVWSFAAAALGAVLTPRSGFAPWIMVVSSAIYALGELLQQFGEHLEQSGKGAQPPRAAQAASNKPRDEARQPVEGHEQGEDRNP